MTNNEKRKALMQNCYEYVDCEVCKIKELNPSHSCGRGYDYAECGGISEEEIDINYAIVFGESKEVDETAISPLDLILSEIKQLTAEVHELKQAIIDLTAEGEC